MDATHDRSKRPPTLPLNRPEEVARFIIHEFRLPDPIDTPGPRS